MADTDTSVKITPEVGGKPTGNMQASAAGGTYFRKGFGLKSEIQSELDSDYTGQLVDMLQAREYTLTAGDLTIRLAKEFGFCYGVERAVEYAYQARKKFPDRTIYLAGEIIHNPHVNSKLQAMGITFLMPKDGRIDFSGVKATDVVILEKYEGAEYFIVRNMEEAGLVCDFIENRLSSEALMERFGHSASPNFDPVRHLQRIGVANQTTMLARESLAIGELVGQSMARAHGADYAKENFRTFDTICSATQERQDAVIELLKEPLDVMVVIGGYNSSNTLSLAALCSESVRTFHVEDADDIDPASGRIRHRPLGSKEEAESGNWLPETSPVRVGVTAGASTPNNKIGEAVGRIFASRGIDPKTVR